MIRPVFSNDPTQPRQTRIAPVFSSGPMPMPPPMSAPAPPMSQPMPSYGPAPQGSRSLVTGDRSLTRNPGGRAGLPLTGMGAEIPGQRGMTPQRRLEIAARRGDTRASELLYRGPMGFGRGGFGPPPGFGLPPPPSTMFNNGQTPSTSPLLPPPLDPPSTMEQASQPLSTPPSMPMPPPLLPWQGQLLPGFGTGPGMSLPPSTMNGATGVPAGPRFSTLPAGEMEAVVDNETGKFVNSYMRPQPPPSVQMLPVPGSDLRVPMLGGSRVPGLPTFQETPLDAPPAGGVGPVRPGTKLNPVDDGSASMPKFQQDRDTGKMFYVVPNERGGYTRKWVDEDGDGQVSAAESAKAAATAEAIKTPTGNQFRRAS